MTRLCPLGTGAGREERGVVVARLGHLLPGLPMGLGGQWAVEQGAGVPC